MSNPPDPAAAPALAIHGLSKSFGSFRALTDIDLAIGKGEFVCFLGPSGCGKTTLLRAIAGLEPQDRGRILQNGRDISHAPVAGRDFGIVFQSYALFPNLTVTRNVGYGLRGRGMSRRQRHARVAELLAMVNLSAEAAKYPAQISGGQQQRVALARALAPAPELLLLDEPLSALDAKVRLHLREQLRKLQQSLGVTTVMVTHDQDEALSIADRIVVMNQGAIEQVGTPEEVFLRPASAFVAGFLGDMNFLCATMVAPGVLRVGSMDIPLDPGRPSLPEGTVRLGIRPADIALAPRVAGQDTGLEAVIAGASFRGESYAVTVNCPALDRPLRVDLGRNRWHELGLRSGASVALSFGAKSLHIFRAAHASKGETGG